MGQNDPADDGTEAERPSGEASSVTMEEFEEMLRRIITAPPKTYEEVKLGKRRRRDSRLRRAFSIANPRSSRASPRQDERQPTLTNHPPQAICQPKGSEPWAMSPPRTASRSSTRIGAPRMPSLSSSIMAGR